MTQYSCVLYGYRHVHYANSILVGHIFHLEIQGVLHNMSCAFLICIIQLLLQSSLFTQVSASQSSHGKLVLKYPAMPLMNLFHQCCQNDALVALISISVIKNRKESDLGSKEETSNLI